MPNSPSSMCDDKSSLIAFIYDECEAVERQRVEEHLTACTACRAEVEALSGLRGRLAGWAPPGPAPAFRVVPADGATVGPAARRVWPAARGWALAAAAVLVLAVGAGVANVELQLWPGWIGRAHRVGCGGRGHRRHNRDDRRGDRRRDRRRDG